MRRLINEIVLDEESDLGPDGEPISHFELYLAAMTQAGVSTSAIDRFTQALGKGQSVKDALETARAPIAVSRFVTNTLSFTTASDHELAAAFAYGREEIIPPTFRLVVGQAPVAAPQACRRPLPGLFA